MTEVEPTIDENTNNAIDLFLKITYGHDIETLTDACDRLQRAHHLFGLFSAGDDVAEIRLYRPLIDNNPTLHLNKGDKSAFNAAVSAFHKNGITINISGAPETGINQKSKAGITSTLTEYVSGIFRTLFRPR